MSDSQQTHETPPAVGLGSSDLFGVWCVRHSGGWCATKRNRKPGDGRYSVETRCNHFVILPWGYEQREPTCEECLAPNGSHEPCPTKTKE